MWVDRLESTIESHQMAAAEVREARGIPGTSVRTTWLCRDKPSMKEALRQAGVPTAASTAADTADEVAGVRRRVGFPLILKPRAGAGAHGTVRVDSMAELDARTGGVRRRRLDRGRGVRRGPRGLLRHDRRRRPRRPRLGRRTTTPTCSRRCGTAGSPRSSSPPTGSTDSSFYAEVREMGARVIEALGIATSATHMEWFYGPEGSALLRDRLPAAGRRRLGPLLRRQRRRRLPRVGATRIVHGSARSSAMSRAVLRRHRRAAPRPATATIHGYSGLDEIQRPLRRVDHRRPPARPGDADPAGGGGLHGQRLRPDAATPTTTRCAGCSTTSGAPSTCTPDDDR